MEIDQNLLGRYKIFEKVEERIDVETREYKTKLMKKYLNDFDSEEIMKIQNVKEKIRKLYLKSTMSLSMSIVFLIPLVGTKFTLPAGKIESIIFALIAIGFITFSIYNYKIDHEFKIRVNKS